MKRVQKPIHHRGVNPGGWGSRPPDFGMVGRGVSQGGRRGREQVGKYYYTL